MLYVSGWNISGCCMCQVGPCSDHCLILFDRIRSAVGGEQTAMREVVGLIPTQDKYLCDELKHLFCDLVKYISDWGPGDR